MGPGRLAVLVGGGDVYVRLRQDTPFASKRTGEDVSRIETCRMVALVVAATGFLCDRNLGRVDRLDANKGLALRLPEAAAGRAR